MPRECEDDLSPTESKIKAVANFFGPSCKAGPWVSDPEEDRILSMNRIQLYMQTLSKHNYFQKINIPLCASFATTLISVELVTSIGVVEVLCTV